jgi:hypothetical protein
MDEVMEKFQEVFHRGENGCSRRGYLNYGNMNG